MLNLAKPDRHYPDDSFRPRQRASCYSVEDARNVLLICCEPTSIQGLQLDVEYGRLGTRPNNSLNYGTPTKDRMSERNRAIDRLGNLPGWTPLFVLAYP